MLRKTATAGVLLFTLIAVVLIVLTARPGPAAISDGPETGGAVSQSAPRPEAELLVLRSDGFKPNEITRPQGPFLLALQNHSSEEELSLVLKAESGASMRQVRMAKRQSKLKEILELTPGRYVLTDANHPEWTCKIVITPNN